MNKNDIIIMLIKSKLSDIEITKFKSIKTCNGCGVKFNNLYKMKIRDNIILFCDSCKDELLHGINIEQIKNKEYGVDELIKHTNNQDSSGCSITEESDMGFYDYCKCQEDKF